MPSVIVVHLHKTLAGGRNLKKGDYPMNGTLHEELKTLLGEQQGPCLSLFMTTFRTGTESQQNQIRLKNLLRGAEDKVLAAGLRPQEVKEFLERP
jgi:hypothetical protein